MMNDNKEVRFNVYCEKCKYENTKAYEEPCNECLEHGMNEGSEKPVNFKEA